MIGMTYDYSPKEELPAHSGMRVREIREDCLKKIMSDSCFK